MKSRNILVAAVFGLIAVLGLIAPAHAGDIAGVLPGINVFASIEGAGLAMLALAIGNIDLVEIKNLAEKQFKAWEDFKVINDARLKALEEKGRESADIKEMQAKVSTDLEKIDAEIKSKHDESQLRIDNLEKRLNRPGAGNGGGEKGDTPEMLEYKEGLIKYFRTGASENLKGLQQKAMTSSSGPEGGYLIPPEMATRILEVADTVTAIRRLCNVVPIGSNRYKVPAMTSGVEGGWIGETEAPSDSDTPDLSEIEIPVDRAYSMPKVSEDTLEDSDIDLESLLMRKIGIKFGQLEADAFISGTGVKKPRGFLSENMIANASYAWGKIGYIATGNSGTFDASHPADDVIALQDSLHPVYQNGAVFLMARSTLTVMRQFKDASGSYYLWNPDPTARASGNFLGAPVVTDDFMPAMGANSYSVAYGNFKEGYTIVDRRGPMSLTDRVTDKSWVKFYVTKRVGGRVTNFEAIKLLKFGAS